MKSVHRLDALVIHGVPLGHLTRLGREAAWAAHRAHIAAARLGATPEGDGEHSLRPSGEEPPAASDER